MRLRKMPVTAFDHDGTGGIAGAVRLFNRLRERSDLLVLSEAIPASWQRVATAAYGSHPGMGWSQPMVTANAGSRTPPVIAYPTPDGSSASPGRPRDSGRGRVRARGSGPARVRGRLEDDARQDDRAADPADHQGHRVEAGRRRHLAYEPLAAGVPGKVRAPAWRLVPEYGDDPDISTQRACAVIRRVELFTITA